MKRRALSMMLVASMAGTLLAGCGNDSKDAGADANADSGADNAAVADDAAAGTEAAGGAADAGAADAGTADGEAVTLKWAIWDQETTPYWGALKDAYEAKNPNVTIEMVDLGSADYMTVLATELSGIDTDFDVVTIKDVPGYATLVQKNTLESLDSYIADAGINLADFNGVTDQVTVDGSLYELPFRSDYWLVFYNKDVFDAAGVAYPSNDMTMEDYDALARQLTDTTYGSQVYGCHYHTWRSAVELFGTLDGQHSVLDGDYEWMAPYYDMILSEEDDGVCQSYTDLSTEGLHYSAAFSNGNVAMLNMGSWFIATLIANIDSGEYDSALCGNWGIASYPHPEGGEAGSTIATITGLSVTSASQHKDQAFDFVNFVSGDEGATIMAETGNFPAKMTDNVIDIISGMAGFPTDESSKEALNITNAYLEVPYAENVSEINSVLDTYHTAIMNREVTVEEGIASMNEEVGKILGN